jgi:DNA replication protein DnaC
MLHQPTVDKMLTMRLEAMVDTWKRLEADADQRALPFEDKLALMVDHLFISRQNLAFEQRMKRANLKKGWCVENIDYRASRGLDKSLVRSLAADSDWVRQHDNIFILGPTGVGKSFLATALAHKACRDGFSVYCQRATKLFRDLSVARGDGTLPQMLLRLSRIDVLVVDDWAMAPLTEHERRDFWEICEDRYQQRSLVLTSQLPVKQWYEQIGDATVAEGILDRIIHAAHTIELHGESLRKDPPGRGAKRPHKD